MTAITTCKPWRSHSKSTASIPMSNKPKTSCSICFTAVGVIVEPDKQMTCRVFPFAAVGYLMVFGADAVDSPSVAEDELLMATEIPGTISSKKFSDEDFFDELLPEPLDELQNSLVGASSSSAR